MILDATTKSLTIVLGEAKTTTDCDITASWADNTPDQFLPGNNTLVSNGTSSVTVVPAPAVAGVERQVQEVTLYNNDTVNHTVYLREHDGSNTRVITSATLVPNASFRWPQASVPTGGTVTEVDTDFGITGGPITTSGTLRSTGSALNTQSGDYTVTNADIGKYIVMTKSTAATLTLTAASLRAGWWAIVTQALTGTTAANKVLTYTVTTGTFDGSASGVDYPGAQRLIEFDGTNFNTVLLVGGFLEIAAADSPFTAALPTRCGEHRFDIWGAGGAGGSGRRGASGTARTGGTAGGGGAYRTNTVPAAYVSTSVVFTVPSGSAGGLAISTDNTNGNPGSASPGQTTVTFGSGVLFQAGAGGPGAGGLAATALSGGAGGGQGVGGSGATTDSQGGQPSDPSTLAQAGQFGGANGIAGGIGNRGGWGGASGGGVTAAAAATTGRSSMNGGAGGGSGGGISAANAAAAGGNGAGGGSLPIPTGGSAGTSGVVGGNGGSTTAGPTAMGFGSAGAGGGSGFDNSGGGTASDAGSGSDGGISCGGGGGGASLNGNNSGAGGKGGDGLARWWYR